MSHTDRKIIILAALGIWLMGSAALLYATQDVEQLAWLTDPIKQLTDGVSYAPSLNQALGGGFLAGAILLYVAVSRHLNQKHGKE